MEAPAASGDVHEAKTPSSIASTPRTSPILDKDGKSADLRKTAAQIQTIANPVTPRTPPTAHMLHDLWLAARHSRRDTDGLHGVLQIVQGHIRELQQELASLAAEMVRQQQAAEIRLMEKECEIRLVQSEAAAYSLAAQARTATVHALQTYVLFYHSIVYKAAIFPLHNLSKPNHCCFSNHICRTVAALQEENARAHGALEAVSAQVDAKDAALQTVDDATEVSRHRIYDLESQVERLQRELQSAQSTLDEYEMREAEHHTTVNLLEAAQTDAACAAGQIADACEENYRLSEIVGELHVEINRRDSEIAELRKKNHALENEVKEMKEDFAAVQLASPSRMAHNEAPRLLAGTPPWSVRSKGSMVALNAATPDPEDLLAVEVSRLRGQTEELEAQLEQARDAAPVLAAMEKETAALRSENAALRAVASRATREAELTQRDLHQVQSEARVLHGQLSEVIASLAGTELANSVMGPHATAGGLPAHLQARLSTPSRAGTISPAGSQLRSPVESHPISELSPEDEDHAGVGIAPEKMDKNEARRPNSAPNSARGRPPTPGQPWRGPHTPNWNGLRGGTAGSESGSELILAELRTAIAHFGGESGGGGLLTGRSIGEDSHHSGLTLALPSVTAKAADVLASISQGIAALGRRGDEYDRFFERSAVSISAGAASVTPLGGHRDD